MPQSHPILSFPQMHPSSRAQAVSGVCYLDPGLAPQGPERYVPQALPMTRAGAAGWLSQAEGFAHLFKKPGELLSAYASKGNDFYSGTAQAIVSELRAMDKPKEDDGPGKELFRAQAVLLLAWRREQVLCEIGGLENGVEASWDEMGQTLGLEPDDIAELAEVAAHIRPDLDSTLFASPGEWLPVLEAMLRLIPAEVVLFVDDRAVLAHWRELGLVFGPAAAEDCAGLPAGDWRALRAPGHELLGTGEGTPGLSVPRLVLAPAGALDAA